MPFEIVRNDIASMRVDAIVNTANPEPIVGYGVDSRVHNVAGPELLEARKKIGRIPLGWAEITPAFRLDAKFVIHAASPVWQDGTKGEQQLLEQCCERVLSLALENDCESIAFPMIASGNHGYPKELVLQTMVGVFSRFLMQHDMMIYLVVFSSTALALSEKLMGQVRSYIDENYIVEKTMEEYGVADKCDVRDIELKQIREAHRRQRMARALQDAAAYGAKNDALQPDGVDEAPESLGKRPQRPKEERRMFASAKKAAAQSSRPVAAAPMSAADSIPMPGLIVEPDEGFSETLIRMIDDRGLKDPEVYKKANIDRKLFSKIRNNPAYRPGKMTALALCIALELDLEQTRDLIGRAGYALTHSSKSDIIVEYFILNNNYNIFELNEVLFAFDQPLIGA